MIRRGHNFEMEIPDGWEETRVANRYIYHGPQKEELVVSGTALEGGGSEEEIRAAGRRALEAALEAMRKAAAHPELERIKELARDESISGKDCWTIVSRTKDETTLFSQAAVMNRRGVLLLTFESANSPEALAIFRAVLLGVRDTVVH